jgi:hypothetical protein
LLDSFAAGDVAVIDRFYGSFRMIASLLGRRTQRRRSHGRGARILEPRTGISHFESARRLDVAATAPACRLCDGR